MTLPASALSFLLRLALFLAVVLTAYSAPLFTVVSEAFAMSATAPDPIDCTFDPDPDVKSPNIRIIVGRSQQSGSIKDVCILYGTERIPKNEVIRHIESHEFSYFVCHEGSTPGVDVVEKPSKYIKTKPSDITEDNLGNLPTCEPD